MIDVQKIYQFKMGKKKMSDPLFHIYLVFDLIMILKENSDQHINQIPLVYLLLY